MSTTDVVRLATEAGADTIGVHAATEPDVIPKAASPSWVVVPRSDGRITLGGMDRGQFRVYDTYETDELAANAVVHVLGPLRPDVDPSTLPDHRQRARDLAVGLQARVASGEQLAPASIPAGTALDHIGPSSGHTLFLLDTPFAQRSSPPTDLQLNRTAFVLQTPLGPEVSVSAIRPWFGQPGGGIMVSLGHPIRWYYDTGILDVLPLGGPGPLR
jgi:hypothetical protein